MAVKIANTAASVARKFEREVANRAGWRVVVNIPRVWTSAHGGKSVLAESYVGGFGKLEGKKNMSKSEAHKRPEWMKIAAALSHFSFAWSSGDFVLCALQGGVRKNTHGGKDELILVEPTIVSREKGKWGCRDGGKKGMESFFKNRHVCSEFCEEKPEPKDHKVFFRPDNDRTVCTPCRGSR